MAQQKKPNRGLGRGLSALMADVQPEQTGGAQSATDVPRKPDMMIPIEKVNANPDQPRRQFSKDTLDELAASVRDKGIIQPLIVRPDPARDGMFQIVAGERRWRAAQMAKLHEVPAIVREYSDTESLEVAIIENIQRADLNPVEESLGYKELMDKFGHTQEKLAEAMGKSRSHIANMMRLLTLPEEVLDSVRQGKLSAGAARALITSDDPKGIAAHAISKGLSVREIERLAKTGLGSSATGSSKSSTTSGSAAKDADTVALEKDLSAALGMKVSINHTPGSEKGAMTIKYASLDGLDDLCRLLGGDR